jgi:hypothetical protein
MNNTKETNLFCLPEHVLDALEETCDYADQLTMTELVAAIWSFEQQPEGDRGWIIEDAWMFGSLMAKPPQPTVSFGGRIYAMVRNLFAKRCTHAAR